MEILRKVLFTGDALQIDSFHARPLSDACGDIERQSSNAVVLPVSGLFSKHDASGRHVIGTPAHAVLFTAHAPYRISFPAAIGDRALILRFGDDLADDQLSQRGGEDGLAPNGLLSADAMMLRNLLWSRLQQSTADTFESEALGLDLLSMSLGSLRPGVRTPRRSALVHHRHAVERVKEAVGVAPASQWSVAKLAKVAGLSPFHLGHVFREMVGASLYDYVLHERLAHSLDAVLNGGDDVTVIALSTGFASPSHFTARFRGFFGVTPTAVRRAATAGHITELRKIMTAQRRQIA